MTSFSLYLWLFYVLSAIGLLYLWWRLVRYVRTRFLRDALLGFLIVLLFTPWFAQSEQSALAPAIFILLHESLFAGTANIWRTLAPISFGYLLFVGLLSLCYWIIHRVTLNSEQSQVSDSTTSEQKTAINQLQTEQKT